VAYAAESDIIAIWGERETLIAFDRDGSGASDADALTAALDSASSEIDSYLAVVATVPLTSAPDVVVRLCVDIAMFIASAAAEVLTDEKRKRYDDAVAWLKRCADGDVSLGTSAAAATTSAWTTANERLFTRSTLGEL
jgi:phage gp36-like protein